MAVARRVSNAFGPAYVVLELFFTMLHERGVKVLLQVEPEKKN